MPTSGPRPSVAGSSGDWRPATPSPRRGHHPARALTRNLRFVALTPILYGVVVLDGLKTSVRMLYLQQRLVELEAELAEHEPLVSWVSDYGFFGREKRIEVSGVDLNSVPEAAQYALILYIYLSLIAVSLVTWRPLDPVGSSAVIPASRALLLFGYGTFTLVLAVFMGVGYLHYRRVRDSIRSQRRTVE